MGILLREDEIYRRANHADYTTSLIDGSDSRRCIDTSGKTGSDSIAVGSEGMSYAPGCRDIEKAWLSRSGNAYASLRKQGKAAFVIEDRQRISLIHEAGRESYHSQNAEREQASSGRQNAPNLGHAGLIGKGSHSRRESC